MSLDIHIGKTEKEASICNPIFSIDEDLHKNIFLDNQNIFIQNELIIFLNILEFYRICSPYEILSSNFKKLNREIKILNSKIDEFLLSKDDSEQFILLLQILKKIIKDQKQNIYFAFD